jgi:ATP-dependent Clp protease ATP-binding subunit ClpA
MFERFTDRARKALAIANQSAHRYGSPYIDPRHILLGIIKENSGVAVQVLHNIGVDIHKLTKEISVSIENSSDRIPDAGSGKIPQTKTAKMVFEHAVEFARELKHNYVGTEHLLLGLLRADEAIVFFDTSQSRCFTESEVKDEILKIFGNKDKSMPTDIQDTVNAIIKEYNSATSKFKSFHNLHEAIAVIREEYLELEQAIFTNKSNKEIQEETIQVAAMCVRLLQDFFHKSKTWNVTVATSNQ